MGGGKSAQVGIASAGRNQFHHGMPEGNWGGGCKGAQVCITGTIFLAVRGVNKNQEEVMRRREVEKSKSKEGEKERKREKKTMRQ